MSMDGVTAARDDGYLLYQIHDFTAEMKEVLRCELVAICEGVAAARSSLPFYDYPAVVRELLRRIEAKPDGGRKGIVGELLVHVVVRTEMPDKVPASVLFNLEDSGYKKGFDLTLVDRGGGDLWFTEVKSGDVSDSSYPRDTLLELLTRAKTDLVNRLNQKDGWALWANAINHAEKALDAATDVKEAVVRLLSDCFTGSQAGAYKHTDASVILAAVIFDKRVGDLTEQDMRESHYAHQQKDGFADIAIIAIQKKAYATVIDFLRTEARA